MEKGIIRILNKGAFLDGDIATMLFNVGNPAPKKFWIKHYPRVCEKLAHMSRTGKVKGKNMGYNEFLYMLP